MVGRHGNCVRLTTKNRCFERGRCAGDVPIRFGAPHVVDHGKNQAYAPDGYQYLVAHGTRFPDGVANWCSGDAIFLIRFNPAPDTINQREAMNSSVAIPKTVCHHGTRNRAPPSQSWNGRGDVVPSTDLAAALATLYRPYLCRPGRRRCGHRRLLGSCS